MMGDISKDIKSTFKSNKIKALINIKFTANWIQNLENKFFKPFGVSSQQYNILRILKGAKKPMKAQTIKERMVDRAPNATRLMDKLCEKHFIERERCVKDRRVVYISISKKGIKLLENIANSKPINLLENLSEEEAIILSDLLDKIR